MKMSNKIISMEIPNFSEVVGQQSKKNNKTIPIRSKSSKASSDTSGAPHRIQPCLVLNYNTPLPDTQVRENRVTGLINLAGGSCFLNVIIQCLSHVRPFRDFYLNFDHNLPPKPMLSHIYKEYVKYLAKLENEKKSNSRTARKYTRATDEGSSISWELASVINHFWRSDDSIKWIKPEALYNSFFRIIPHFDPRDMQDCDEFFRLLMDILDCELKAAKICSPLSEVILKQNAQHIRTHISILFEGIERDELICCSCEQRSYRLEPFKSLAIAMTPLAQDEANYYAGIRVRPQSFINSLTRVSLTDCLYYHFQPDTTSLSVSNGEGYNCSNCKTKQNAVKQSSLLGDHLPYVLCVSLKRFVRGRDTYKIWNPVHFEEFLSLADYIHTNEKPLNELTSSSTKHTHYTHSDNNTKISSSTNNESLDHTLSTYENTDKEIYTPTHQPDFLHTPSPVTSSSNETDHTHTQAIDITQSTNIDINPTIFVELNTHDKKTTHTHNIEEIQTLDQEITHTPNKNTTHTETIKDYENKMEDTHTNNMEVKNDIKCANKNEIECTHKQDINDELNQFNKDTHKHKIESIENLEMIRDLDYQKCVSNTENNSETYTNVQTNDDINWRYQLIAVIQHDGSTIYQGHYTCFVKHLNSGYWYKADDKNINVTDLDVVLNANPYMLMYVKSNFVGEFIDLPSYGDVKDYIDLIKANMSKSISSDDDVTPTEIGMNDLDPNSNLEVIIEDEVDTEDYNKYNEPISMCNNTESYESVKSNGKKRKKNEDKRCIGELYTKDNHPLDTHISDIKSTRFKHKTMTADRDRVNTIEPIKRVIKPRRKRIKDFKETDTSNNQKESVCDPPLNNKTFPSDEPLPINNLNNSSGAMNIPDVNTHIEDNSTQLINHTPSIMSRKMIIEAKLLHNSGNGTPTTKATQLKPSFYSYNLLTKNNIQNPSQQPKPVKLLSDSKPKINLDIKINPNINTPLIKSDCKPYHQPEAPYTTQSILKTSSDESLSYINSTSSVTSTTHTPSPILSDTQLSRELDYTSDIQTYSAFSTNDLVTNTLKNSQIHPIKPPHNIEPSTHYYELFNLPINRDFPPQSNQSNGNIHIDNKHQQLTPMIYTSQGYLSNSEKSSPLIFESTSTPSAQLSTLEPITDSDDGLSDISVESSPNNNTDTPGTSTTLETHVSNNTITNFNPQKNPLSNSSYDDSRKNPNIRSNRSFYNNPHTSFSHTSIHKEKERLHKTARPNYTDHKSDQHSYPSHSMMPHSNNYYNTSSSHSTYDNLLPSSYRKSSPQNEYINNQHRPINVYPNEFKPNFGRNFPNSPSSLVNIQPNSSIYITKNTSSYPNEPISNNTPKSHYSQNNMNESIPKNPSKKEMNWLDNFIGNVKPSNNINHKGTKDIYRNQGSRPIRNWNDQIRSFYSKR